MPKGKTKLKDMTDEILDRLDELEENAITLDQRLTAADNKILALDEAICPKVAARLTRLERSMANLLPSAPLDAPVLTGTERYRRIAQKIWARLGYSITTENVRVLLSIIESVK